MTILIVEDQTMVRELLVLACSQAFPFAETFAAGDAAAALAIGERHRPGLVIVDLGLAESDGVHLLQAIVATIPAAKVIALSSHLDEFTLQRTIRAQVDGLIDKNEPLQVLREAITAVLAGRKFVSSGIRQLRASVRADPVAFDKLLSGREQEVLCLIGGGLDNLQGAHALGISHVTAKHHRANVMAKLDLHSTPKLIRYALEKGFTRIARGPRSPHPAGAEPPEDFAGLLDFTTSTPPGREVAAAR